MGTIVIDPVTRIEGHLKIEVVVENGVVKDAHSSGTLFRGFEMFMKGHNPTDAQHYTQRICGVCPVSHGVTSVLNLDSAFGIADKIPANGRIIRNLIQAGNTIQSHILHFYHLAALDYVDVTAAADYSGSDPGLIKVRDFIGRALAAGNTAMLGPFFPRYEGDYRLPKAINQKAVADYVKALDMRRLAHEMTAIYFGRIPHGPGLVVGGVTQGPTADNIQLYRQKLTVLRDFIDNVYLPDVIAVAEVYADHFEQGFGCGKVLSYGVFDLDSNADLTKRRRFQPQGVANASLSLSAMDPKSITEDVKYSRFSTPSAYPGDGDTKDDPHKTGAYTWLKAPRYKGGVHEVGPMPRMLVAYLSGDAAVKKMVDDTLTHFKAPPSVLFSTLGRHAARALECKLVADAADKWLDELKPGEPFNVPFEIPDEAEGMGLWEAPRGALGHWISIKDKKIDRYQCVVPSTWDCSPRDDKDQPGPIEQSLIGAKVKDEANPFEVVRIVRAYDPCLACAVHLLRPNGDVIGQFRVA
ncbi:nickel-dependent hydrogenase large subunit [Dehalogenimonas sp. 4OHTPN]|uniref:Nickel-dependent hydrogenase large subunit n=1 Tax=Dehalogenimonas sp. 4OHTPN TaxID=3166643 RepID=A0AAU8G8U6_9CHLR